MPSVATPLQALGALYVMEGSALGGRVIARMLRKSGQLPENVFNFFDGYQENTGLNWQAFILRLNQIAASQTDIDNVCAAANETFAAHARWMKTV